MFEAADERHGIVAHEQLAMIGTPNARGGAD